MHEIKDRYVTITVLVFCIFFFLAFTTSAAPVGTETRISFSADPFCQNYRPSADNGWIVWEEACPDYYAVIAYNYSTGVQLSLSNASLFSHSPRIMGNRVVWYEETGEGFTSVYYTDLTTIPPVARRLNLPQSYKTSPVVDGDIVVWEEREDSFSATSDILMYNISSQELVNLTPDTDTSSQTFPSIFGDRVIWADDRYGQQDIFMNTTYSGWDLVQVNNGIPGSGLSRPMISGNRIIWFDDLNTIYLSNLTMTTTLPTFIQGDPISDVAVSSTYYAWKEDTGGSGFGPWDIFFNDSALSGPPDQITDSGSLPSGGVVVDYSDQCPVVITPDLRIIWVDDRNDGSYNIYMFSPGTPAECPGVQISAFPTEGPSPLDVTFSDTSPAPFTHWRWEFGDGSTTSRKNTSHRYSRDGIYMARLVAGTPYCRNVSDQQMISVGIPAVFFSGTPTEGIAPLAVDFRGTATGSPTAWFWEFGDGGFSDLRNPRYVYSAGGIYTVNLTASNSYGKGMRSRSGYIHARNGLQEYAFTNITGISVAGSGSLQSLIFDKTVLPVYTIGADKKSLTVFPPAEYGWQKITFISADATGFSDGPATVTGRISTTSLTIRDLQPVTFSSGVGPNLKMNYTMEVGQYFAPAYLLSRIWEGTFPSDDGWFNNIIHASEFSEKNVAYTLDATRHNLTVPSRLMLNLSVGSGWLTGSNGIDWGRQHAFVIAMGNDSDGSLKGMVLPAHYTFNDTVNHLEYFEAEIPKKYSFLNKFALATLAGTGNPFQLITLTVTRHIPEPEPIPDASSGSAGDSPVSGTGAGAGKAAVPVITSAATTFPTLVVTGDPGTSAKVYTNGNGIVTQATKLQSADGRAVLSLAEGATAKDAGGNPLTEITIKALPAGNLPAIPSGSTFTFAGMAYEIGPDGATFSPAGSLAFSLPQAPWGQDYSVKFFDQKSGTWVDLPTAFDTATGTVRAQISHLCTFALFAQPHAAPATPAATPLPVPSAPAVKAQPPASAMGIFSRMIAWAADLVVNNVIILAIIIVLVIAVYLFRQGRFPGTGQ